MRYVICLSIGLMGVLLLGGCGGGSSARPAGDPTPPKRSAQLTQPVSLEQLAADLAAVGKSMPDFLPTPQPTSRLDLLPTPPSARDTTRAVLPTLSFNRWLTGQSVARGRTSWFEINLINETYPYDVAIRPTWGDPDLFVFEPVWVGSIVEDGYDRIELIGYSVNDRGDDQVGSFAPEYWGGSGRYLVVVYGYAYGTNRFSVIYW
jgi:hypothetical protein